MAPRPEDRRRCLLLGNCLVVVCRRVGSDDDQDEASAQDRAGPPGWSLFRGFVHENAQCFWNQCLVQSVACLEYRGYLIPSTIFVSGNEYTLEVVRSAWSRRVLRPPVGYEIQKLGDVSSVEMVQVLQTQFAPLAEALCKAVFDLTSRGSTATLDTISAQLGQAFPAIERPGADVVYRALGALIRERRLYHTGLGYQVAAPDTFLQTSPSPVPTERPMLLTNEEAISRLHGSPAHTTDESAADGSTLERSASMRLLRTRAGASDEGLAAPGSRLSRSSSVRLCRSSPAHDGLVSASTTQTVGAGGKRHQETSAKRDGKSSMFSRWFRRSRSEKRSSGECKKQLSSFSAQFPPLEWSDPDYARFHSRATQTNAAAVTQQPDTHPYAALLKPRSSSTNRARERHSSNGDTPDASLDRSDRRSRSSRGYYRGPRKAAALAAAEDLDSSGTLLYRHRSASPAARRNNHSQNNGSRHGGALAQSAATNRRLPSTAEIRTPPLSRRAYRHQRALPPLPVERLNNGGLRQDDQRYRPPNFTNNALEKASAGDELPPSGKPQQPSDYTNNNRLPRPGPVPLATFEARRSSIAGTTLDIDNVATSRIRAEAQRNAPTAFSMKNLQQQPSAAAFPMRGGAHISADDLKNLHKAEEKVEPRPIAAIKNLQCGPMVISKVPPQPQVIEPRRTTTTTTFTTTDTVTLKNIQNLSSVADLDKTKPSPQTLKNLQPSTNTTTVSIKQTNGKIDDDIGENTKKIATNLILEEKIEAQRKSGASSPSVAGPIKKIVEEKSVQSTLESTGKMGNLKSTVDVNMELVTEVGSSRTVTNITTSLQHALPKAIPAEPSSQDPCNNKTSAAAGKTIIKTAKPTKMNGNGGGYTPMRAKLAEAKAAFFADSANKGSADDSGFVSTSPQPVPV